MNLDARWSLLAFVPAATITLVVAWGNLDRLPGIWTALLVLGTAAAIAGLFMVAVGKLTIGGLALLLSAFTLPTGFGFVLNIVLGCLALALVIAEVRDTATAGQHP